MGTGRPVVDAFMGSQQFTLMHSLFGLFKEMMGERCPVKTFVMDKLAAQLWAAVVLFGHNGERSRAKTVLATAKKQANSVDHALLCGAEMLLESGGDWKTVLGALYYEPPYDGDPSQFTVNKTKKSSIQSEEKMVHFAQDLSTTSKPSFHEAHFLTVPNAELSSVSSLSESQFGSLSSSKVTEPTESVLGSDSGVSETPTPFTAPGRIPLRTLDVPPHLPCFKGTGESTSAVIERSRFLPRGQENVTRSASFTEPSKREIAAASDSASLTNRSDFGRSTLAGVSHSVQSTVPPSNQISVGHLFVNGKPYWILGEIGRGGSSVVYSALDSDQNLWALKDVNLRGASKELADSYLNEVDMLLTLRDTGRVIRLHDHEQTPTSLYLILELASVDLKDVFMELFEVTDTTPNDCPMGKLSPLAVAFYWDQMLRCVKVLHDKRIVHLDLKPQNFVLVRGKLKLIDLGVSQRLPDDSTRVNPALQLGTLTYMSPEQLDTPVPSSSCPSPRNPNMAAEERFRIGRKSDIWALGVMLYLMVYSRSPFPQPTMQGRLLAIINPAVAIEFPPIENQGIYKALQRSLVRDYKDRASVEELLSIKYGS
ncbi:serine/threonine-protein kinase TTK/MPS1 [Clonorchis sinensis]|uniref:Serine/threonine-protein kinase TTK/MPS1 n=1 Tax=Clonorchis sinensis TaxID=79923 RepID=G7Y3P0_CLOSI|nr:serine/threonine-protein kinase TTK/MPS1 [Clonorchis sinensis]